MLYIYVYIYMYIYMYIYINDRPNNLILNVKPFADDTSIFSIVNNNFSTKEISNDLKRISEWAYQ